MKKFVLVLLISSLGYFGARAAEPERHPLSWEAKPGTEPLKYAIALEADRLAQSSPASERRVRSQQPTSSDNRVWCSKHGAGCGALIGYAAGFIFGLVHPDRDFTRFGWALLFSGPLGAGVGAVVGCCISDGDKTAPAVKQGAIVHKPNEDAQPHFEQTTVDLPKMHLVPK